MLADFQAMTEGKDMSVNRLFVSSIVLELYPPPIAVTISFTHIFSCYKIRLVILIFGVDKNTTYIGCKS